MPGAGAPPVGAAAFNANNNAVAQGNFFGAGGPGGGQQASGYNYGLQNLQKSLGVSNQTTQAQQMQLGQQLQQNQAGVQQNMASRGLGNTTVAATMGQAPLQTYNLGMAQVGDLSAQRQMGAYNNLAQAAMQGGNQISQLAQPYAQTNFTAAKMAQMAGPSRTYSPAIPSDFMQGQPQAQQAGQYQNLMAAAQQQNPGLYVGPGMGAGQQGTQSAAPQYTPDQLAMMMQLGGGDAGGGDSGGF